MLYTLKLDSCITVDTVKNEYIYYTTGNVKQIVTSLWKSGQWVKDYKIEYSYDPNGNCVMSIKYWWIFNYWSAIDKAEYQYNNNNNILSVYIYKDSMSNLNNVNEWKNNTKYEYEYTNTNYIKTTTSYSWRTDHWIFSAKNEYTTDNAGRITLSTNYSWEDNQWKNAMKIEYLYNGNGYLTQKIFIAWILDKWENLEKFNYAYNFKGNTTLYSRSGWGSSKWVNHEKIEYTYDNNNNMILSSTYRWKNDLWNNYEKSSVNYDQSIYCSDVAFPQEHTTPVLYSPIIKWYGTLVNKPDSTLVNIWDTTSNTWNNGTRKFYYFSPFIIPIITTNASKNMHKNAPIALGKSNNGSILLINNKPKFAAILEIYSVNGRMVKKINILGHDTIINISTLSTGVYWVKLSTRNSYSLVFSLIKL